MIRTDAAELDVFSVQEIARAAGTGTEHVRWLLQAEAVPCAGSRFVPFEAAVSLVRRLRAASPAYPPARPLFAGTPPARRTAGVPVAAAGALHAGLLAAILLATGPGTRAVEEPPRPDRARLVFLVAPGPGGGGGGGGLRRPEPPPAARSKDASRWRSPVAIARIAERPRQPAPEPRRPEPVVPAAGPDPLPQPRAAQGVVAPVVSASDDSADLPGAVRPIPAEPTGQGPGEAGGTGSGSGSGTGEGRGSGIGHGTGAGTGGGPFRPGSGISPPVLEREVKPAYTEDARRRGIEGDILLEVVVRADGTVGQLRVIHGLEAGLDRRAIDAVRQWRFAPARRAGAPVDVLVQVTVELRLR